VVIDRSTNRINQLKEYLAQPASPQAEIDALYELAWELRMSDPEQVNVLCAKVDELSQHGAYVSQPYTHGLAASLVNQAFVETYEGHLDGAVSKCLQALVLLRGSVSQIEIRVWFTLGWNSFFLGDYPAALENGIKALHLARELGDTLHEAWSLDAVASFHGITGDFETAIQLHQEALTIFQASHETLGELRTLNNLAVSLHETKQYEQAFTAAYKSWELAKQSNLDMDVCNNSCTMADILIGMDRLDDAENCLQESVSEYLHGTNIAYVNVLERIGRIRLLKDDLAGAESFVMRALELARKLNQPAEEVLCHQTLSEIYERQAQYSKALEHYKKLHEIHKVIQSEQATKRLAVLKVTHQVETAQREAEIYRLEAAALQRKVNEQKIIQSVLEFQNTIDPLTGLYNRRYFDEMFEKEYSRHSRSGSELSVLMMDVDHFKAFNDTYGHVRGDECLRQVAEVIRNSISRPPDLAARYGGEEFVCLLPETSLAGAERVAENIRQGVGELSIPHHTNEAAKFVTVSVGVITAECVKQGSATELLVKADKQLYVAKSHGRNRVEVAQA